MRPRPRSTQLHYPNEDRERVDRGLSAEDIFFEAARLITNDAVPNRTKPAWLDWIMRPTTAEDTEGTDGLAGTDKGTYNVQIKRSIKDVQDHFRKHPDWEGIFVIIPYSATPLMVAESFLDGLIEYYEEDPRSPE